MCVVCQGEGEFEICLSLSHQYIPDVDLGGQLERTISEQLKDKDIGKEITVEDIMMVSDDRGMFMWDMNIVKQ